MVAAITIVQILFAAWIIRNLLIKRKIAPDQSEEKSFISPASVLTWFMIALVGAATIWLCVAGSFDVADSFAAADPGTIGAIVLSAVLLLTGDIVGRKLTGNRKYKWYIGVLRFLLILFVVGPAIGLASTTLIEGVDQYFRQSETLFGYTNWMRAIITFSSGAFHISILYALWVPSVFEKWATAGDTDFEDVRRKYSLKNQLLKTLEGINNRWLIVLPNFVYMNLLPLLAPDLQRPIRVAGSAFVIALINIYVSWKSGRSSVGGNFIRKIAAAITSCSKAERDRL